MNHKLIAQIYNPVILPELGGSSATNGGSALGVLLARLFRASVVVGGLALFLFIAWGGLQWITAGGDKGKVEEARNRITNGIIGMAFLVATIAIVTFLSGVFGIDLLNPVLPNVPN